MDDAARVPLTRLERWGVIVTLAIFVAFGLLVEYRSAFLSRRMGDLGCYLRGAWAARVGTNLYEITDNNNWHYNYPPFFAILLVPFADPPAGQSEDYVVPFALTAALWYMGNVLCLARAVHSLAAALEKNAGDPCMRYQRRFCRRWWALRLWPIVVCLAPIAHTLMRSQVNLLIVAFLCAMTSCFLRGQRFRAGMWLAAASAIKLIPLFLLVYPAARRDWRCLGGALTGLLATLVVIPVLALGPGPTWDNYKHFARTLLGPALKLHEDESRQMELLGTKSTDNQSLAHAIFHLRYPATQDRPARLEPWAEWANRLLGLLMTAVTLAAGYRAGFRSGWPFVLFMGAMMYLMTVLGPVCHLHYFTNLLPLVMALLAARWEQRSRLWLGWGLIGILATFMVANYLPHIPSLEIIRDFGLPTFTGLGLWGLAVGKLWNCGPVEARAVVARRQLTPVLGQVGSLSYAHCLRTFLAIALLVQQPLATMAQEPAPAAAGGERGIVLVIGGIGGMDFLGAAAQNALPRAGVKHEIREFVWTHGWGQLLKDLQDHPHLRKKAEELADYVRLLKAANPNRPIFLVAKSGGTGLALACAELLPANTLERIVLLSAAVTPSYDLRRALQATRTEIVSFHSPYDQIILNLGTRQFGTVDRVYGPSAGLNGFLVPTDLSESDRALYRRVVQVPWNSRMLLQMHNGMHVGTSLPSFLAAEVAPWLR